MEIEFQQGLHNRISDEMRELKTLHHLDTTKKREILSIIGSFGKRHVFSILANVVLMIAIILYLATLLGCEETSVECLKQFDQATFKYYGMILVTSGFLFSLIYNLAIYRVIHYSIAIYTTIILIYVCYVYDTGNNLKSHGAYNRVFLFTIMFVCFILQHILALLQILCKRVGYVKGLIGVAVLFIATATYIHLRLISSCSKWSKGLNDTEIDNTIPGCQIKKPRYCWMNLMDNVFDVSGWMGEDCNQIRMDDQDVVLKWTHIYYAKRLGYPRVEDWSYFPESMLDEFQFNVLREAIDMDDPDVPDHKKDVIEIIVDYSIPKPEMSIRIKADEKLVETRSKVRSSFKNTNFIAKNVIHLFIDSLSRDNFRRKLIKTHKLFENLYENKNFDTRVYQFLKYHAVASWTFINMVPSMFGVDSNFSGSANHSNKFFKDKGFILGQAHNNCGREFYDLEKGNIEDFNWIQFDHEGNVFACDPNYTLPGHPFAMFNGPYGMKRRCLYGKDTSHYVFQYGKEFWKAYNDQPKYLRLGFVDAHEGTGEVAKYLDDKIIDFIDFLEAQGSLKDTVILLQSDHGVNMPGFYTFVDAEDFWIEKTLPALFMMVPQKVADKYDSALKSKENLLLSPYDIHNTLLNLAGAPKLAYNNVGESIFKEANPSERRSCDKFNIVDPYCNCLGERDNPDE